MKKIIFSTATLLFMTILPSIAAAKPLPSGFIKEDDMVLCGTRFYPSEKWGVSARSGVYNKAGDTKYAYLELSYDPYKESDTNFTVSIGCQDATDKTIAEFSKKEPRKYKDFTAHRWMDGWDLISATRWRRSRVLGKPAVLRKEEWSNSAQSTAAYFIDHKILFRISVTKWGETSPNQLSEFLKDLRVEWQKTAQK